MSQSQQIKSNIYPSVETIFVGPLVASLASCLLQNTASLSDMGNTWQVNNYFFFPSLYTWQLWNSLAEGLNQEDNQQQGDCKVQCLHPIVAHQVTGKGMKVMSISPPSDLDQQNHTAFLPSISANTGLSFTEWKALLASCCLHIFPYLQTQLEPAKIF